VHGVAFFVQFHIEEESLDEWDSDFIKNEYDRELDNYENLSEVWFTANIFIDDEEKFRECFYMFQEVLHGIAKEQDFRHPSIGVSYDGEVSISSQEEYDEMVIAIREGLKDEVLEPISQLER
jgi:hypothetical protein